MERQITVRMPEDLLERLDHEATALSRKRSEVIRVAVERFLARPHERAGRPVDRVRDLLGSFESGIPDLGQRHREHLVERLRRGLRSAAASSS
jgi:Arc/MetJ-type ribon-helix-helix transcriptional regulator